MKAYDYIIVGGGSTGCIVASRLAAANYSVLLLEAGGKDNSWRFKIPVAQVFAFNQPKWDWCYTTEPDPTRHNYQERWAAGKVLGGGSSLNGLIYMRGLKEDYDRWQQLGNQGWGFADVLPYFQKIENKMLPQTNTLSYIHHLSELFIAAAKTAGYPFTTTLDSLPSAGVGYVSTNQIRGRRMSSAKAYLQDQALTVITYATATRVLLQKRKAIGIEYLRHNKLQQVYASQEIILSAGSIESPKLLLLSGIGDRDELKKMDIVCQQHLPGVGQNLQDHAAIIMHFTSKEPTMRQELSPAHILKNLLRWYFKGKGPFTSPVCQANLFMKTALSQEYPDILAYFTPLGFRVTTDTITLQNDNAVMIAPCVLRPKSRGSVSLHSNDPLQQAKIFYPFFAEESDLHALREAGKMIRNLFATQPLKSVINAEQYPGIKIQTDEEWHTFIRQNAVRCFHYSGTCKMGNTADSVVDANLRVHGIENLRIADASIMPTIVSANTCATAFMIGEKAADIILRES